MKEPLPSVWKERAHVSHSENCKRSSLRLNQMEKIHKQKSYQTDIKYLLFFKGHRQKILMGVSQGHERFCLICLLWWELMFSVRTHRHCKIFNHQIFNYVLYVLFTKAGKQTLKKRISIIRIRFSFRHCTLLVAFVH